MKECPEMEKPMSYEYGDRKDWAKDFDKYEKQLAACKRYICVEPSDHEFIDGRQYEEGEGGYFLFPEFDENTGLKYIACPLPVTKKYSQSKT